MDYAQEQALKILEASYDMYERTKKEVERKMRDDLNDDGSKKYSENAIKAKLEEIQNAQDDIIQQYEQTGGNVEDLKNRKPKKKSTLKALKEVTNTKKTTAVNTKNTTKEKTVKEIKNKSFMNEKKKETKISNVYIPKKRDYSANVSYDVIPLPSKGQAYRHKNDRLQVAYLTANDENMFVSPNLYRDGLLIDFLLNEKILEAGIDPDRKSVV